MMNDSTQYANAGNYMSLHTGPRLIRQIVSLRIANLVLDIHNMLPVRGP